MKQIHPNRATEQPRQQQRERATNAEGAVVSAATRPGLTLDRVVKRFGSVEAVKGVSLDVAQGSFVTLLGPSGSGKTTLLRMIAGFMDASEGTIRIGERDVSNVPPGKRDIGMVFQNYALFPHMTVLENVCFGLKARKWEKTKRLARAREVLELVGLSGFDERLPRQLSGGQQQRVALARALAFNPAMLLMDEPLGALDRELRIRMAGELRRLHEELNNTVLYVTHDREEALALSDRIAIMRDGRLEAVDVPQTLFACPETAFVATFFGGHNCVPCDDIIDLGAKTATVARVRAFNQELEVQRSPRLNGNETQVQLAVPGDALEIAEALDDDARGARATVHSAVYMGNQIQVACELDGHAQRPLLRVDLPGGRAVPPAAGTAVRLSIKGAYATAVALD